ncbi:MAG: N-6 DNA methylase [Acidimicrobiales bacterium]|nr:N-6 DNA methylase [Acidimicrobiales bacterium]MCB9392613.1 N-6 DNA methylase [Acidimicrobiaceae bacterium]
MAVTGSRRKALGAWYTPDALVDHVVAVAFEGLRARARWRVLDPACGDGRFLVAARRHLLERGVADHTIELVGVDVDPSAVEAARAAIPTARVVLADALADDWGGSAPGFDVVIGNPPFVNQLAAATSRGGRSRHGGGPYADVAAEFLALAAHLARPDGGRVAFVLPQSVLAARDAASIRTAVLRDAAIRHCWWAAESMFDAAVRTCAVVLERGGTQTAVTRTHGPAFAATSPVPWSGSWPAMLVDDPAAASIDPTSATGPVLGDVASFAVDFRDQYYGLVGAVGDDVDGPPLVTSGLIEPGRCLWGERPVRFAKQRYTAPRVALDRLTPRLRAWAERRLVPKILIANQTRTIEAVHDPAGAWLPGVPVITCVTDDPYRVLGVLSGDGADRWVRHHAAGSGLSADTVRLSPALLASIPLRP